MGRPLLNKKRMQVKLDKSVYEALIRVVPEGERSELINAMLKRHLSRKSRERRRKA